MKSTLERRLREPSVQVFLLPDTGAIPNHRTLPLVVYEAAFDFGDDQPEEILEQVFGSNRWRGSWRNGIYPYHHYHSTAHEVLGVTRGSAKVQFGGEPGVVLKLSIGDVVIIPAGVGHKNVGASAGFTVVGAYPDGQEWDLCYGKADERPRADQNIAKVPLPSRDPVFGEDGPLFTHWIRR
ncbi:MAG: cupin domain-containing protein [Verrucomicrobiota bacterium]